jgi:Protein of unknown function (DUF4065)
MTYNFNNSKAINLLLYVLEKAGGKSDFLTIFKTLYFADEKHLSRYGRLITGDWYAALPFGPAPSGIYDILKAVRGDSPFLSEPFSSYFSVENRYNVIAHGEPDLDEFSESEIECLDKSIGENVGLDFDTLSKKSHGSAWKAANANGEISITEIAKEGGASSEMIKYILSNCENLSLA